MNIDKHQLLLFATNLITLILLFLLVIWIARALKKFIFELIDHIKGPSKAKAPKDQHREEWERWKQDREYEEYLQWKREKDAANK